MRARNFDVGIERIDEGARAKGKGKPVSVNRRQGQCKKMESINASAQEETHVASATMKTNVENRRAHPLLLQNRRRKAMGKILRRESI